MFDVKKLVEERLKIAIDKLSQIALEAAQLSYGDAPISLSLDTLDNGFSITASGEEVCFIEFGAGVLTTDTTDENWNVGGAFKIEPGSYSISHAKTYQEWEEKHGGDFTNYPYNVAPRPGMYNAYKAVMENLEDVIIEVFT